MGEDDATSEIQRIVKEHGVVLFQKGTRQFPQCGFSEATIGILDGTGVDYESIDCLDEDKNPGLRDAIKNFSQWPTIPQVYVKSEFIGGADIIREMVETGELKELLKPLKEAEKEMSKASFKTVSPEEAYARIEGDGYVYIDVRTEGEFEDKNIPGSVLVPAFRDTPEGRVPVPDEFTNAIANRYPDRESKLVIGCRSGVRSKAAADWLCEMGYSQLLEVDGGITLWASNPKLPTRQGTKDAAN